jgi:GT2 family glycosyltransferase
MKWVLGNILRELKNRENYRLFFFYLKNYGPLYTAKMAFSKASRLNTFLNEPFVPHIFYPMKERTLVFRAVQHPAASIIIPVHNNWDYTFPCLYSILENAGDVPYEVILADDASTDETRKAGDLVKNIKVLRNEKNLGFLRNCNNAARQARGEYIVFLNNDANVQKGWLESLVKTLEKDKTVGMAGSKLVYPDGKLQEAGAIVWRDGSAWNYGRDRDPSLPEFNYLKEADYVSGASIIIRKSLWDDIGGFDERYLPAYSEDSDLAFELRKRGYKVVYQPASVVVHFEGKSHGTDEKSGIKKFQPVNKEKFIEKWQDVLLREQLEPGQDVFLARDRTRGKKTILIIDHYVPEYDRDAGSKTIFQYMKLFLEMGLNVKFIGDNFMHKEPYAGQLEQMGVEILAGLYYSRYWKNWIKENAPYLDYVLLSRPYIAVKYLEHIKKYAKAKIIYYGHDLHYLREERRYESEKDKKALREARRWKKLETRIMGGSDLVLTLSELERELIEKELPGKEVRTFPVFVFNSLHREAPDFAKREGLLFVAGFAHTPNVDGILWFLNNIFPAVLRELPKIKLYIVGSNPPEAVSALASSNVIITGYLSDEELLGLYKKARLAVIPLRYGAGVKGKTVEAMYQGLPLVSTSIGTEGLINIDKLIEPKDTAGGFANEVISLYRDEGRLLDMSKRCTAYVNEYYSKTRALAVMREVLGRDG